MEVFDLKPPAALQAEDGWQELDFAAPKGMGRSFVSGEPDGDRLRVHYFKRVADGALVGKAWFGPGTEGPPGHAHGGSMAAVLDEAMGGACFLAGHIVLAGRLTTEFKRMVPLGSVVSLEAWVERIEGRKITVRSRLVLADGQEAVGGEGLFVELAEGKLDALMEVASEWMDRNR